MHMANHLVSTPVAVGSWAIAAGWIGFAVSKCKKLTNNTITLAALLAAFVFGSQMVNFQLPGMPGTSGHFVGVVLCCMVLGCNLGSLVVASVLLVQCLMFNDGGLLAFGCNVINMAIIPAIVVGITKKQVPEIDASLFKTITCSVLCAVFSTVLASVLVPVEALISGVSIVSFGQFASTMANVHLIIGLFEAAITGLVVAVLFGINYNAESEKITLVRKKTYVVLVVGAIVAGCVLSMFACQNPDGLEWTYAERPDQPAFTSWVVNELPIVGTVDKIQDAIAILPDYSLSGSESQVWTVVSGLAGAVVTAALLAGIATVFRKKAVV